jgi:CopG family nickel-responsive transcriptional regulator
MSELVRFCVSLDEPLLRDFDRLTDAKGYPSRSKALSDLIRDYLVQADWSKLSGEQVGTLTLVYNHDYREITDRLTDMQHDSHGLIVCATHVHLTAHTCLEVIVLRGAAAEITKTADRLLATRGVQHGKLTMTTLGRAR